MVFPAPGHEARALGIVLTEQTFHSVVSIMEHADSTIIGATAAPLEVGAIVSGRGTSDQRYLIVARLGSGGMGEVWEAWDESLQRRVALKAIRAERRLDPGHRARFLREARMLSRLDHPNICRVYDYVASEGTDLLVLELLDGETLRAVIRRGLTRAQALTIAERIADVLVTAHGAGVVHRDLKPENVMLTAAGEVKVLDFGLARSSPEVEGARRDPAGPRDRSAAVDAQDATSDPVDSTTTSATVTSATIAPDLGDVVQHPTAAGAIVGTPGYMSPEQARGEPATPASDAYALGLLIRELATGRRRDLAEGPSADQPAAPVRQRALRGDLARLVEALTDLVAPRRPSAAQALERLRRIRAAPRRRVRRAAVTAAVLAVVLAAAKYTVDLRRERGIAVAARREADNRRDQAEKLIGFMLGDLRSRLEPLGRLDILDRVGDEAMAYFAAVSPASLSDQELFRRSEALRQIGQVRLDQGSLESAQEAFERSHGPAEELAARGPHNGEWVAGLGATEFWLGYVRWLQGDTEGAQQRFEAYLEAADRLVALDPGRTEWRMEQVYAWSNLGSVLQARGRLREALTMFENVLQGNQRIATANPDDLDLQLDLAHSFNSVGTVEMELGRIDEALAALQQDVEIKSRLVARDGSNMTWRRYLAVSRDAFAKALALRGRFREAVGEHRRAVGELERLTAHDPENADWARELAGARIAFARTLDNDGEAPGALHQLRTAIARMERLVATDPGNADWSTLLARAHMVRGGMRRRSGRPAQARRDLERARALLAPVMASRKASAVARRTLAEADLGLGKLEASTGEAAAAKASWQEALEAVASTAELGEDVEAVRLAAEARARLDRKIGGPAQSGEQSTRKPDHPKVARDNESKTPSQSRSGARQDTPTTVPTGGNHGQ